MKFYFHPSWQWGLVFGVSWFHGKTLGLKFSFVTVWIGPFSCAIGLEERK